VRAAVVAPKPQLPEEKLFRNTFSQLYQSITSQPTLVARKLKKKKILFEARESPGRKRARKRSSFVFLLSVEKKKKHKSLSFYKTKTATLVLLSADV
jgi:hypothetical protein